MMRSISVLACIAVFTSAAVAEPVSETSADEAPTVRGVQVTMMPDARSQENILAPQAAPSAAASVMSHDNDADLHKTSVTQKPLAASEAGRSEGPVAGAAAACVRAPGLTTDIVLKDDASAFDARLAGLFRQEQAQIVVDLDAPIQLGAQPEPAQAWLGAVQEAGGAVEEAPLQCMKTRGLMTWMRRRIARIFTGQKAPSLYALAEGYDVTLYYDEREELIRQIVFKRREPEMLAQN